MITDLIVEGYQSLRDVKLRLGALTVVTGASSSGKTALFRATELVAFNARGTGYVARGVAKCVVGLGCQDEGWAAAITRGARGSDAYRVSALDPDGGDGLKVWEYTKLGGKVPDEAAQVVNLTPLNFAGQFDPPFLLRDTASEVARVLGQLTNVTLIFRASQEAGRRKKALGADLKSAEAELARLRTEAQRFAALPARLAAAQQAEAALAALQETQARAAKLQASLSRLRAAQAVLSQASPLPPEPPDLTALFALHARHARLTALLGGHQNAAMNHGKATEAIAQTAIAAGACESEIAKALEAAGICPTCGQEVHQA
jgi:DNA repair protein SbcC/Rad50